MKVVQIDNWQDYQRDGEQFLRTANRAFEKRKKTFSPATLYNITCMAIEKLTMAFLMKNGDLAENHTMGDLQYALQRHLQNMEDLVEDFHYLDSFQEICDLETYTIRLPSHDDTVRILNTGNKVLRILKPHLDERSG